VEGDTVLHQRGLLAPTSPRKELKCFVHGREEKMQSPLPSRALDTRGSCRHRGLVLDLVGGERVVFFALPSALVDAVAIVLLRPTDGFNNLHKKRLNIGCSVTHVGHYIRHHFLAINTVSN
jgi:hypothetical protein